jgi:GTP-binding protein
VCINKIDREGARPLHAYDQTLDLFIDLGANEDDLFFPHLYTSGVGGFARMTPDGGEQDMRELFEMILHAVPPPSSEEGPFLLQVNNLDYSDYLGRMFGGKILRGTVRVGDRLVLMRNGARTPFNVTKLWVYEGISMQEVESISAGEIGMMSGLDDVLISDTIADPSVQEPIAAIDIEQPTLTMSFYANQSPLAGKDGGKHLTIQRIRERLERESKISVALKIDPDAPADTVKVFARGELQLAILIENMRREGYEMAISRPKAVLRKGEKGETLEPIETLTLEFPEDSMGPVMTELSKRRGDMVDMSKDERGNVRLIYEIPTRGLIGFRSNYLTLTRGFGILSQALEGFGPFRGEVVSRSRGALIAKDPGKVTRYAYEDVQERGQMFYEPGTEVYGGMIVGECARDEDMVVNITKQKAANNMRSSTSDATTVLDAHREFSLEQALAWLRDDELLEVTPKMLRFRKELLDHGERRVAERRN